MRVLVPMMSKLTILDGGMSRELIALGAPFRQPEWSALSLLEAPQFVSQVHQQFLAAGADVITTNSYAIVPFHLGEDRFWQSAHSLAKLAGRLAREAADAEATKTGRQIRVAGCLPPIFGSYEPQNFDKDQAHRYLKVLVDGLAPYVDIWLAETLSVISEAEEAYAATASTQKPFWVAFTPDDGSTASKTSVKLRSGQTIAEAATWATETGVEALLFNCARPEYMDGALQATKNIYRDYSGSRLPLTGIYANTFIPRSPDYAANSDVCSVDRNLDPQRYSEFATSWISEGINILGGCCGVGHEHIQLLHERFRSNVISNTNR